MRRQFSTADCYAGHRRLKVISWRRQIAHVRRRVQARSGRAGPGMRRLVGFGRSRARVGRADALQPASGADDPPRLDVAPRCSFRERERDYCIDQCRLAMFQLTTSFNTVPFWLQLPSLVTLLLLLLLLIRAVFDGG